MNSVFFSFNKYKKNISFSFLAAGFCPKNLAFARKIMVLPESGGVQPPSPLARRPDAYTLLNHAVQIARTLTTAQSRQ